MKESRQSDGEMRILDDDIAEDANISSPLPFRNSLKAAVYMKSQR